MRPRIIEFVNHFFGTNIGRYLVPEPAFIYALMLGIGIILYLRRSASDKLHPKHARDILIWAIIGALLGGRLFFLIQHVGYLMQHPKMLLEINGGTVSFGVYIGGISGMLAYAYSHRIALPGYADVMASVLGVGPMVGRIACFLNGDDYGTLSNLPWAVRYPHGSYPFLSQVEAGLLDPMNDLSLPVHPVQLYGSLKGALLFLVFTWLWRRKALKPGALFFLYWICYAMGRFVLEFFRGDEDRGFVGPLSTGQFMSVIILIASLLGLLKVNRKVSSLHPPPLHP